MATADRHIGDLNVELTKGQGRSIKLTSLLTNTSTTVGQWSAVAGANGSQTPTCTEDSGSLLVSWSDSQATASIGRSWRLRLDGDDVAGGQVRAAGPQASPGTASVAIQVDPLSEATVTIVVTPAGPKGDQGDQGDPGPPVDLSSATPAPLGTASAGAATEAAKGDHVHAMPSAADVGALPGSDAGFLPGERNYGDWDNTTNYPTGAVVHDHDGDGNVYVATAPNVGEQPSLSPGSWDLVNAAVRGGAASGLGAVADVQGTALGFAAEAGLGGIAQGYFARAGEGGFAVGAFSVAGDHAIAIGQFADASEDGEVVIGAGQGLLIGAIDFGTQMTTAAALPGGFIDLPATTIASNPAVGSLRIVARAAGLAVRDENGIETAVFPTRGMLAVANPASIAAVSVAANAVRVPELTTASFTWPAAGYVMVRVPNLAISGAGTDADRTTVQIRWTKNAWSTSTTIYAQTCTAGASPFYIEGCAVGSVLGSPAGVTPPAAGDTVQVAVWVSRPDTYSMTVLKNVGANAHPFVAVEVQ